MSEKLPVNDFNWVEETSQFNKDFIKAIIKIVTSDILLKLMSNILKNCINVIIIYFFCLKEQKTKKLKNVKETRMIKKNMLHT